MRHAVVIAPQGLDLPLHSSPALAEPIGALCVVLEAGGNAITVLPTGPDLRSAFEGALESVGSGDDLLVFIAGSTVADGDGIALRTGEGDLLLLRALSDAVRSRNPYAVAFVIETADERSGDVDGTFGADVRPFAASLDARGRGYTLLVGWRPRASVAAGAWPFTRQFVEALDDERVRDERGAVPLSRVFERLVVAGGSETSVACERAWMDFVVLEPADVVQMAAVLRASEPAPPRVPTAPPVAAVPAVDAPLPPAAHPPLSSSPPPPPAPAEEQRGEGSPGTASDASPDTSPATSPLISASTAPDDAAPGAGGEAGPHDDDAALPAFPFPEDGGPPSPAGPARVEPDPFPAAASRPLTPLPSIPPPAAPAPPATPAPAAAVAPAPTPQPEPSTASSSSPPPPAPDLAEDGALPAFPLPDEIDDLLAAEPDPFPPPLPSASSRPPPVSPLPPPPARGTAPSTPGARSIPPPPAATAAPPANAALPPPRPPEPSLPPLDALLDLADGARARGALREALAAYKGALALTSESDAARRAVLHTRVGEIRVAMAKSEEAEMQFEKALDHDPGHRAALDGLVALAIENKEPRLVIARRRRRLRALDRADERVADLRAIARVFVDDLADASTAAEALEEARVIDPRSRAVVDDLRAAYERLGRWSLVVQVLSDAADALDGSASAQERAAIRFSAAEVALSSLRDEPRALALLDRGLEDDPANDRALRTLASLHAARKDWDGLDAAYARMIGRLARIGDVERAWSMCRTLAGLRRTERDDVPGTIEALSAALSCKPGDAESRALLADLLVAQGDADAAVPHYEQLALQQPTDANTYARLFELHQQAGRVDRAWLTACALEELGAADMDQQLVVDQYRSNAPIRAVRSLPASAWDDLLRGPGSDDVAASIFAAIGSAAAAARVDELRDARKLVALDPERRHGTASTASAVRSFHWAANVLGIEAPHIYAMDEVPGGIAAVTAAAPSTVLGPGVLRGVSTKELAFLAGRHLTYYRPEHYALLHYPTLTELSALFLAAVKLAIPDLAAPDALAANVARMRKALARRLDDADKKRLGAAVERLQAREGRVDLAVWIRSVELTAHRAGLLLCGDLAVALGVVRGEIRTIGELSQDDKRGDLLAYGATDRLDSARAMLGVDARASVAPPPAADALNEDQGKKPAA